MTLKRIATACLLASVALAPAQRAAADGDALVGAIIGGIIGGAIVSESQKGKQRRTTTARTSTSSGMSSAQREANREVQVALNYFGFPVGSADGVLGRNSRAAIANYQAILGYPATGQLTEYERTFLVGSYQRAIAGGAVTAQQVAANPMGVRGLLTAYRDESLGIAPAQTTVLVQPTPAVLAPAADAPALANTGTEGEGEEPGGLPTFMGGDMTQASLASHCNKVSLLTSSNGGFITAASMTDPTFALSEQFCLARTYAIALGEDMASRIQGFTPQQIAKQCEGFGPTMKDHVTALSRKPRDEVLQDVSVFVQSIGMAPEQLVGTSLICLSVGYRTDNMDVALSSALLLTAWGDGVYAELLGHHLSQGFGTSLRPDLALAWYEMGLEALAAGAEAVFVPGQPERTELIRKAAYTLVGRADEVEATLPTFVLAPVDPAPAAPTVQDPAPTVAVKTEPQVVLPETTEAAPAAKGSLGGALGFVARLPLQLLGN